MEKRPGGRTKARVRIVGPSGARWKEDHLATEEPLEIRLKAGGETRTLAVTMRTPGADFELAAGFLRSESVIAGPKDVRRIVYCTDAELDVILLMVSELVTNAVLHTRRNARLRVLDLGDKGYRIEVEDQLVTVSIHDGQPSRPPVSVVANARIGPELGTWELAFVLKVTHHRVSRDDRGNGK